MLTVDEGGGKVGDNGQAKKDDVRVDGHVTIYTEWGGVEKETRGV